jgi:DNA (cytosine-5)-methyltransferase 1
MPKYIIYQKKSKEIIGVDLFAGAGGLSLGAVLAGIKVVLAIDSDSHAIETYKHNHRFTEVVVQDIRKVKKIEVQGKTSQRILFGGPPCQGFSTSNQRTRTSKNQNNWLFLDFIRLASQWLPQWVVIENVKGIKETENGLFFTRIKDDLVSLGYTVSAWTLNAVDFGIPQRRERVFIIGSIKGIEVPKPQYNKSSPKDVTVREAISDLPLLVNGASKNWKPYKKDACFSYAQTLRGRLDSCSNHLVTCNSAHIIRRYAYVPQGGNWEDIPPRLMKNYQDRRRCHTGIYHRLRVDEPSVVIGNFRKNMLIHPLQNRGLSVREAARIQSFPDWYEFKGSIGFQQQQVGNSVPPLLAKAVFDSILNANSQGFGADCG